MTPEGQTIRLLLRPLALADAEQIQEHFAHWEIVKFMTNRVPWPYPPDGALQFLRNVALPQAERGDGWQWTIRLRSEPGRLIGVINLLRSEETNRGFWLGLPWQGQGFMSEACAWANDFWFEKLGFPVLRVAKVQANIASRRISERQGMRMVGTEEREFVSGLLPAEIWEITAEEWRAWKVASSL